LHLHSFSGDAASDMAEWFYGKDNAQHGPVSDLEIRNLVTSAQIDMNTIVWREGMTEWLPMKDISEFQPAAGNVMDTASPYASPQTYAGQAPYVGTIPTDGMSIAALVLGILAVMSCWVGGIFGIPAVICGHMSLKKIKYSTVPIQGRGMAIAGLITGYIGIAMSLFFGVFFIVSIASGV
jgi:hypothetical protein